MSPPVKPVVSRFEFWHPMLFYAPLVPYYTWLAIRHRSITLPSAVNPSIYSGGICRESKSQILDLVPAEHRESIAKYAVFRQAGSLPLQERLSGVLEAAKANGINLPFVAKPDEGQRGDGVQKINTEAALREYLRTFPQTVPLIVQELIDWPGEAGVLYYRHPDSRQGSILSITLKELPQVVGDGTRSIRQLVEADSRAKLMAAVYLRRQPAPDRVPVAGESVPLVFAGNHCQGAIFRDGTKLVTPELVARFAAISDSMPEFYFGRFDVKYKSLSDFLAGGAFKAVEINAASAESTHIWDAEMTLTGAYKALFNQFRILFEIGSANRKRGHRTIGTVRLLKDFWDYKRQAKDYPPTS